MEARGRMWVASARRRRCAASTIFQELPGGRRFFFHPGCETGRYKTRAHPVRALLILPQSSLPKPTPPPYRVCGPHSHTPDPAGASVGQVKLLCGKECPDKGRKAVCSFAYETRGNTRTSVCSVLNEGLPWRKTPRRPFPGRSQVWALSHST